MSEPSALESLDHRAVLVVGVAMGALLVWAVWRNASRQKAEREAFAEAFAEAGRTLYSMIERGR